MVRAALPLLVLVAVLAFGSPAEAAGDGGNTRANAAHTGAISEPRVRPPLRRLWTKRFDARAGVAVIADDRLVVALAETARLPPRLAAVDARTGKVLWSRGFPDRYSAVAAGGGRVFVAVAGRLHALSASDGTPIWEAGSGTAPIEGITYADETLYTGEVGVSAWRASDGTLLWQRRLDSGGTAVAVADGVVYAADGCGQRLALRRQDGARVWEFLRPGWNGCNGSIAPAVANGRVFTVVDAAPGDVFDTASGASVATMGTSRAPAIARGIVSFTVFSPIGVGRVVAADAVTGDRRWTFRGDGYLGGAPFIVDHVAYIGSGAGRVFALELATGRRLGRIRLSGPIGGLTAGAGRLFVSSFRTISAYR